MSNTERITKGNLTLLPGGVSGARELTPEQWLDDAMQEFYACCKANDGEGPYPSRRIANGAHRINFAHRYQRRPIADAIDGDVSPALLERFPEIWREYIDRRRAWRHRMPRATTQPNRAA